MGFKIGPYLFMLFCFVTFYHLNKLSVKSVGDAELGLDWGGGHKNQIDIQ